MKTKEKLKRKQGISLIVLVITIIVIVILAVAVILSIANNNPIENANKAKAANNEKTLQEAANLAYSDWYTEKKLNKTDKSAAEYVTNVLKNQNFSDEEVAQVNVTNEGIGVIPIPNGFQHVSIKDDNGNETSTVSGGYVIKDVSGTETDGNEFVWVPVNDMSTFIREVGYYKNASTNKVLPQDSGFVKTREPSDEASDADKEEYNKMMASVSKYHGFYMGRYEASKNATTNKAQSIADQDPLSSILWTKMVEYARDVYSSTREGIKEKDPVSTLVYGVQWDQTVRWLSETNYSGIKTNPSTIYGNFSSSVVNTGSNKNYSLNNIYDMRGNVDEATMEGQGAKGWYITRGGQYTGAANSTISYRNNIRTNMYSAGSGFRMALYLI